MGFRIESWGDDSRRLGNLLYIGRQMAMLGSLRYNAWQTPEGEKRGSYQVRAKASQYSVFGKNQQKDIPSIDISDKPASVTTVLESEPPF